MAIRNRRRDRRRNERGTVAVVTAIAATLMMAIAGLAVDLGNTWARRGSLQVQADQAALFAGHYLPANTAAEKTRVAQAAAYYIVCHPVVGQNEVDHTMPKNCPSSPSDGDSDFNDYAQRLLDDGSVSFPTVQGSAGSYLKVTAPASKVDFGFGVATGKTNSVQTRSATSMIGSPGTTAPMSLSLNCLLSAALTLPNGIGDTLTGILPLNYIAPGPITVDNVVTKWPNGINKSSSIGIASLTPSTAIQNIDPGPGLMTGAGLTALQPMRLIFALGDQSGASMGSLPYSDITGINLVLLTGGFTVPSAVYNKVGTWKVKLAVKQLNGSWLYSTQDYTYTVQLPTVTQDLLGCARLIKTPRDAQQGTPGNLDYSLKTGVDHPIATNPNLATLNLPSPLTTQSLLDAISSTTSLMSCNNISPNIYDTGGTHPTPNCVMPEQGANTYKEFTGGILGPEELIPADSLTGAPAQYHAGRLVCTDLNPCKHDTFTLPGFPGQTFNNDTFTDYVPDQSLLTADMFFSLDTYLTNNIPVLTPESAISSDIYSSARFMWVPIVSSPVAPNNADYYPVLTYRPIFVTQNAPPGLDAIDLVVNLVDTWVQTLLGIDPSNDHGLLMSADGTTLRAMRFMSIEPWALPAPPDNYGGPLTEYVGTGPKVVRLIR